MDGVAQVSTSPEHIWDTWIVWVKPAVVGKVQTVTVKNELCETAGGGTNLFEITLRHIIPDNVGYFLVATHLVMTCSMFSVLVSVVMWSLPTHRWQCGVEG